MLIYLSKTNPAEKLGADEYAHEEMCAELYWGIKWVQLPDNLGSMNDESLCEYVWKLADTIRHMIDAEKDAHPIHPHLHGIYVEDDCIALILRLAEMFRHSDIRMADKRYAGDRFVCWRNISGMEEPAWGKVTVRDTIRDVIHACVKEAKRIIRRDEDARAKIKAQTEYQLMLPRYDRHSSCNR